jgi:PAS domain S-box-containing protein
METKAAAADEREALRRCVRELAGLSTLSAVWSGSDLRQIADGLSGVLSRALPVSVVYVRVHIEQGAASEAVCTPKGPVPAGDSRSISAMLEPLLKTNGDQTPRIANPFGAGTLQLLVTPLGYDGDCGVVIAGSQQADFPSATDRLLLGVAANQAVVVLQQRRSEERIRRSERELTDTRLRLASIVESSEDAILSIDLHGTITSWNRGAQALYGYAAEEIVGRPISVLIPPAHQDDVPTIMARFRRGERIDHYETRRLRKDGTGVDVSLTVSPILNDAGQILGASKIARDITQRRQAEETLRRQTERLRLLWEAAGVLLAADEPEVMLRGLLRKIGPHLGVDAYLNYMVTESGEALRLSSCEGIPVEATRQVAQLEFGQAICGTAARDRRPIVATHIQQSDDPKVQLAKSWGIRAYACNPLVVGNRLLGTLSFASRLKDQFDTEEVAFIETICHYVTVACERLRLLDELKAADRRKDEFLAILAHELRNPLAPILSAVKVLHLKGSPAPEARGSREIIDRQIEHLTRLVDDLLDVSRITRNRLELRRSRIDLTEVIAGAVESSRPLIEQCGHELTVSLPPEPVYVDGDLVRLTQVFMNLLNNAAKYTERPGRLRIVAERQDTTAIVRVADNGVGIAPDKLSHLFEMFYQVDGSLERAQSGLGLGLSLVRFLVEAHGGRVEARSEGIGKGSEFVVHLPVFAAAAASVPAQQASGLDPAVATGLRIVVADDNRDSADLFAMLLRLSGNDVHTAYDGVSAVETAERVRPDAVILDIGMPRLNGEDACRRIRATPWGGSVMMIAVTGWDQEESRRRIVDAGFDAHLIKPVDPGAVIELLASRSRGARPSADGKAPSPHGAATQR